VGGLLFSSAAPPLDFMPGVLLGLGGSYLAFAAAGSLRRAAQRAWLWALTAGLVGMAFVPQVVQRFTDLGWAGGVLALLLLCAFQALHWGAAAAIAHTLRARFGLPLPLAFGALVFIAISLPTVIAWSPAAVLSPWPRFIQLADLVGERGVSLLLALAAALAATPLRRYLEPSFAPLTPRSAAAHVGAALSLMAALAAHGTWRMADVERSQAGLPRVKLGVVQAAVPARLRWQPEARQLILQRLRALTREAELAGAELVVWPEAAYPYTLPRDLRTAPGGERRLLGEGVRGPILFGLLTRELPSRRRFNSATLVEPDGDLQTPQDKLALLWFGETVPLSAYLPFLTQLFRRSGYLTAGSSVELLEHGAARIGVLNCYEDILPGLGRRIARARPNLLVNVTNDAWFGPTTEPELHLRLSVLRAVEARLDLVRAVNLGVPAWIDATGRIRLRGNDAEQSVMHVAPALNETSPTLYTKAGDIPVWVGLLIATLAAARAKRESDLKSAAGRLARHEAIVTERDPSGL
jgi:apolipoprotein N-acyltransferase